MNKAQSHKLTLQKKLTIVLLLALFIIGYELISASLSISPLIGLLVYRFLPCVEVGSAPRYLAYDVWGVMILGGLALVDTVALIFLGLDQEGLNRRG